VIRQSYEKDYIAISEEIYEALRVLRKFNFERIYIHPKLKLESSKVKISYRILFEYLLHDLEKSKDNSYIWRNFLSNKSEDYLNKSTDPQKVIDYVSGMTDTYFVRTLEKLIVPKPIEWV